MEKRNIILIIAEILVMGGILTAFIAPVLFPSEEPTEVGVNYSGLFTAHLGTIGDMLKTPPSRDGNLVSR